GLPDLDQKDVLLLLAIEPDPRIKTAGRVPGGEAGLRIPVEKVAVRFVPPGLRRVGYRLDRPFHLGGATDVIGGGQPCLAVLVMTKAIPCPRKTGARHER